jgi:hypothetical protein
MSTETELKPWLFTVQPLPGESLSHFLGRVRRCNHLSVSALGELAGIGAVVARWEKFRHNPFPSPEELGALGDLLGIDVAVLRAMLPPPGESLKMEPIRLCGAWCLLRGGILPPFRVAVSVNVALCQAWAITFVPMPEVPC